MSPSCSGLDRHKCGRAHVDGRHVVYTATRGCVRLLVLFRKIRTPLRRSQKATADENTLDTAHLPTPCTCPRAELNYTQHCDSVAVSIICLHSCCRSMPPDELSVAGEPSVLLRSVRFLLRRRRRPRTRKQTAWRNLRGDNRTTGSDFREVNVYRVSIGPAQRARHAPFQSRWAPGSMLSRGIQGRGCGWGGGAVRRMPAVERFNHFKSCPTFPAIFEFALSRPRPESSSTDVASSTKSDSNSCHAFLPRRALPMNAPKRADPSRPGSFRFPYHSSIRCYGYRIIKHNQPARI